MSDVRTKRTLEVTHISKMSAFKVGLVVSVVMSIAYLIILSITYIALDQIGVLESVNSTVNDLASFTVTFTHFLLAAAALAILNIIFIPIIAVVAVLIYNLCSAVIGGVRMSVSEVAVDNS